MPNVALSPEQLAVFERIEHTREHVFVTGRAGTGKSTILNHLSFHTSKIIAVCAPTGVAALNVGGQTIHSLLRLPTGVIADHDLDQPAELKKMLAALAPGDVVRIEMLDDRHHSIFGAIEQSVTAATA